MESPEFTAWLDCIFRLILIPPFQLKIFLLSDVVDEVTRAAGKCPDLF